MTVRTPDDRELEVLILGTPGALPLVFHHGTPGGVAVYPPMAAAAAALGLQLVLYARPGYGGSSPRPGRSVADAAGDVAAILDELGVSQFVTLGWSGGGPHALACAQLLPGRCLAAATLAGVAPYRSDGLDWLAGMAEDNIREFTAALAGQTEVTALLDTVAPLLRELTGDAVAEGIGDLASPADKEALRGPLADYLAEMFRAGLLPGIAGWRDDDLAFVRDWGFSLAPAGGRTPVAVWQGDQDLMVPFAHGQWLAANIPAAKAHLCSGAGHMTLPIEEAIAELLELSRAG